MCVFRQKACLVTCTVFSKYVKKEIVTIVDDEKVSDCACEDVEVRLYLNPSRG